MPLHSCPFPTHPGTGMDASNFEVTAMATWHSTHTIRYATTPPRLQPCTQPCYTAHCRSEAKPARTLRPDDQHPQPLCNHVHSHLLFPSGTIPMSLPLKSEEMGNEKRGRNEERSRGDTQPKAIGWPLCPGLLLHVPCGEKNVLPGAGISLQEGA